MWVFKKNVSKVTKEETFLAGDNSQPVFSVALDGI